MADAKNRERGLRAAINNPRVSEEAKQHDRELLASEFGEQVEQLQASQFHTPKRRSSTSKKSSSTEPHSNVTEGQSLGGGSGGLQQMAEEKDRGNVIRGLKAALKNPHVSEKAKEADRKKLQELGETVE